MAYPRLIAWLNTLIPLLAVVGGYQIAIYQQVAEACVPLFEGCTSVSRGVRNGDALFWFRGWMMPLSTLMVLYWILQYRWLNSVADSRRSHSVILILGVISAIALVLYANFLGSQGDFYRFMRRFGVTFYFAFAALAQLLSLRSLRASGIEIPAGARPWLIGAWVVVTAQWCIGVGYLAITLAEAARQYQWENIVEWNFALAMVCFYGLSGELWHRCPVTKRADSQ